MASLAGTASTGVEPGGVRWWRVNFDTPLAGSAPGMIGWQGDETGGSWRDVPAIGVAGKAYAALLDFKLDMDSTSHRAGDDVALLGVGVGRERLTDEPDRPLEVVWEG